MRYDRDLLTDSIAIVRKRWGVRPMVTDDKDQIAFSCSMLRTMLKFAARHALDDEGRDPYSSEPPPDELSQHWIHCARDYVDFWQITADDMRKHFSHPSWAGDKWLPGPESVRRAGKYMLGMLNYEAEVD